MIYHLQNNHGVFVFHIVTFFLFFLMKEEFLMGMLFDYKQLAWFYRLFLLMQESYTIRFAVICDLFQPVLPSEI